MYVCVVIAQKLKTQVTKHVYTEFLDHKMELHGI